MIHPNVIPIHSVSSDGPLLCLVIAYIRGGSLQKRLENSGPLDTIEVLRIGSQIAAGLAAAHEQGLVHRDIKPENVLMEAGIERGNQDLAIPRTRHEGLEDYFWTDGSRLIQIRAEGAIMISREETLAFLDRIPSIVGSDQALQLKTVK